MIVLMGCKLWALKCQSADVIVVSAYKQMAEKHHKIFFDKRPTDIFLPVLIPRFQF